MKIAWIGSGKISKAFFESLNTLEGYEVFVVSRSFERVQELEKNYAIIASSNLKDCVKDAKMIVLAIKPNLIESMLIELKTFIEEDALIVSLAAGISLSHLQLYSQHPYIVRVMPSTAVLIRKALMALSVTQSLSPAHTKMLNSFFGHFGQLLHIDESQMNAFIASSGSGIAYVYAMIEAMVLESQKIGFNQEAATKIIFETFSAAIQMAQTSPLSLEELMLQVASKGGTTEAGLQQLREPLQALIHKTFKATLDKAEDLSK